MSSRRARRVGVAVVAAALAAAAGTVEIHRPALAQESAPKPEPKPEAKPEQPPAPPAADRAFRGTADELATKFPQVVRIAQYGKSAGGRALRVITVSASAEADVEWAALVVAHLSGDDPWEASKLAVDVAARLAESAADLPPKTAFRVIADASPDAVTDDRGAAPRAGNDTPVDEDQDGDTDEDAPDDLDGDGVAGWMRIPDAAGAFAADDPAKPGAAPERADPSKGKPGAWRIVREGRDDDGDGEFNEDGPGGVDVSRNFATFYEEHTPAAGRWATSEPETRALMDLLLADERIAVVYEIGRCETIAAHAEWTGSWPKLPDADAKSLEGLRAAHGEGPVPNAQRKPRAPGAGSLGAVVWHQLGRLWLGRAPLGKSSAPWPEGTSAPFESVLEWKRTEAKGVPAGTEVLRRSPRDAAKSPAEWWTETASVTDFLRLLAKDRATVAFAKTETSGEPGVLRVETRLVNSGRLPTHTQRGVEVKGRRPLNVRVALPAGAKLLAGRPLVQVERLGGGEETGPMGWVVAGASGSTVTIECVGPDTGRRTLEVKIP